MSIIRSFEYCKMRKCSCAGNLADVRVNTPSQEQIHIDNSNKLLPIRSQIASCHASGQSSSKKRLLGLFSSYRMVRKARTRHELARKGIVKHKKHIASQTSDPKHNRNEAQRPQADIKCWRSCPGSRYTCA